MALDTTGLQLELSILIKLICGRTRAGKTTYSQQFDNVIHLDYCGGLTTCYNNVLNKVSKMSEDVVVEGIYNTAERRKSLLEAYKGDGEKICIWIDTPLDVIKKRLFIQLPSTAFNFEPPTLNEGWDSITIINNNY